QLSDIKTFPVFESEQEPGLVCWPSLWREPDGLLKMRFVEVRGDPFNWPPQYAFGTKHPASRHASVIRYFSSRDEGRSWQDCGWTEDADPHWTVNSDTHSI